MGPPEDAIPRWPASWYLFDHVRHLRRGPTSRELLGRRLTAFRTTDGSYAVLDAHCAHLGSDLGKGCVVENRLRCPYHHWEYATDGRCVTIPTQRHVPGRFRVGSYPCVERHGYLFFFNGVEQLFPLPFFDDCDPAAFAASQHLMRFELEGPWYFLPGNAFDGQHFEVVHDRRLLSPPEIDSPTPFSRRVRFYAEITGESIYDRLLRSQLSRQVRISITSCAGPYVLVTGDFGRAKSYILVANRPTGERTAASDVIVYAPRRGPRVLQALWLPTILAIRRWFTHGFMRDDFDRLAGMRYEPSRLVAADRDLAEFLHWLCRLPQSSNDLADTQESAIQRVDHAVDLTETSP